jgi:hypothetical protein
MTEEESRMTESVLPATAAEVNQSPVVVDPQLRRLRERVAAGIAIALVAATIGLIAAALLQVNSDTKFALVKDLMLFVNPLVGVAVGYYFNKVTSEARAETAEAAAKDATHATGQAVQAAADAKVETNQARQQVQEVTSSLSQMVETTAPLVEQPPGRTPGVLGPEGAPAETIDDMQLRIALARARSVLQQQGR